MTSQISTGWPDLSVKGGLLRQEYVVALGELHLEFLSSIAMLIVSMTFI